jgi:hypothetical protein
MTYRDQTPQKSQISHSVGEVGLSPMDRFIISAVSPCGRSHADRANDACGDRETLPVHAQ